MNESTAAALAALRAVRGSPGYAKLTPAERAQLDVDLAAVADALGGTAEPPASTPADPYAVALETPAHLARLGMTGGNGGGAAQPSPQPASPPPPPGTEVIGARARRTLEAVDFPAFVAGLISGTFQAIVDATVQQIREYAKLVASLAQSVEAFARRNVSANQARDWLVARHPQDLTLAIPPRGESGSPRLLPRRRNADSPSWLSQYGLGDRELTAELTEGELIEAARRELAEERMQALATMVLMGINRIVVSDGQIRARLQFHASAAESVQAQVAAQSLAVQGAGIAGRTIGAAQAGVSTMVSTVGVNAQADVAVRANLVGEVSIRFRSETFDLERFADSQAIQLITSHARAPQPAREPAPSPPAAEGTP